MFELNQLEQLIAIAECQTISAAAERLHLSQPALSRSIQKLEAALQVTLFDREKNKITLNENGKIAVEYARRVLEQASNMTEQLQALADSIKKQSEIENLISAKTGGKALVTIGDTVEVILEAGTLNETTATQVKEVVLNKTDVRADQIMIVEAKTENA